MHKIIRLIQTLWYLKPIQIGFQLYYRWLGPPRYKQFNGELTSVSADIGTLPFRKPSCGIVFTEDKVEFKFLNQPITFQKNSIHWNYAENGKLWTYNLNYFDFLAYCSRADGIQLIEDFIAKAEVSKDGMEPYPTSLRLINWIRFSLHHQYKPEKFLRCLTADILRLRSRIEYHLLANHLLENFCALWIAAWYFNDYNLKKFSGRRLLQQLEEQFNQDGMHYELSPMYHYILMERLLDCYLIIKPENRESDELEEVITKLRLTLGKGLGKLNWFHIGNNLPAFGDSVNKEYNGISTLQDEMSSVGILPVSSDKQDSGYYKLNAGDMTLFADYGNITPSYQPGHAHADTFGFVVYDKETEVIADTGISTYNIGDIRSYERSTTLHNTISIANKNSSDVWGGFRVGRRATVKELEFTGNTLSASHDGYRNLGLAHTRTIRIIPEGFQINDILNSSTQDCYSCLHFHPSVKLEQVENGILINNRILFQWEGIKNWDLESYDFAMDYNIRVQATKWKAMG